MWTQNGTASSLGVVSCDVVAVRASPLRGGERERCGRRGAGGLGGVHDLQTNNAGGGKSGADGLAGTDMLTEAEAADLAALARILCTETHVRAHPAISKAERTEICSS